MILGIDEVGRGPWAGPVTVGAVVLPDTYDLPGLDDSKKLTAKRREHLAPEIRRQAVYVGLGWVSAHGIDHLGIVGALQLATRRAVEKLPDDLCDSIVIDGTFNFLKDTKWSPLVSVLKKADHLVPSVSAASVVAKVARDAFMAEQDKLYPGYGFAQHVGYGTAKHAEALRRLAPTPLHRMSYAPLKRYASVVIDTPSSKSIGDKAETVVAEYLVSRGHTILERNWRQRDCEIDIISQYDDAVYFTEVKYRRNDMFGGGVVAIDAAKQQQMRYAAQRYLLTRQWSDRQAYLSFATVSGQDYRLEAWMPIVD